MDERAESLVAQVIEQCQKGRFTGLVRVRTREGEGELRFLSGIREEARFGISTGDEAFERLLRATSPKFEAIARLPGLSGGFKTRLAHEGAFGELHANDLMRYCEANALTCVLELSIKGKRAQAKYQLGELTALETDAAGDTALAELLETAEGTYRFVLPELELPENLSYHVSQPPPPVELSTASQSSAALADQAASRRAEELQRKAEAEAEATRRKAAEEEARRKAEAEARRKAEEEARRKAEEEARRKAAEEEARRKAAAEAEARRKAEEEARRKAAEEEARRKAEIEARRKAEAEAEARRKAEEEARRKAAEEEARRKAEEEARRKAEEEAAAKRQAEEEEAARRKAEEEARRKAEAEAEEQRRAEEEARRKAEKDEARRKIAAEEKARRTPERAAEAGEKAAMSRAGDSSRATETPKRANLTWLWIVLALIIVAAVVLLRK